MNANGDEKKLDWMYKDANSLVDREEYLLGRSVDKSLEQINAEEKEKKLGLVPPKNHVEHECIPPSIRDFNKIIQAEQVDISAKLQEDPLVAIKKREEEARRLFLQNPVQLKKLQDALKSQELKKKKKHKKSKGSDSDSGLDSKIRKKLKLFRNDTLGIGSPKIHKKKSKDNSLDTILMHKFNQLKDKLSQEDLNDILAGKNSDSEEEKKKKREKRRSSSGEDERQGKLREKNRSRRSSSDEEKYNSRNKSKNQGNKTFKNIITRKNDHQKKKQSRTRDRSRSRSSSSSSESDNKKYCKYKREEKQERHYREDNRSKDNKVCETNRVKHYSENSDSDLESKILQKLRMLRNSIKSDKTDNSSSENEGKKEQERKTTKKNCKVSSDETNSESNSKKVYNMRYDSENDEQVCKPIAFGLVKSDGTKIALNRNQKEFKTVSKPSKKVESLAKTDKRKAKRLTDEEKDRLRREMMKNAEKRDKERSENLRMYREEDKKDQKNSVNFDKDFVHKELVKTTKDATVETRIKSNLNNIQRSSRHMDSHFSRRN